jgi:hypothetical protein
VRLAAGLAANAPRAGDAARPRVGIVNLVLKRAAAAVRRLSGARG